MATRGECPGAGSTKAVLVTRESGPKAAPEIAAAKQDPQAESIRHTIDRVVTELRGAADRFQALGWQPGAEQARQIACAWQLRLVEGHERDAWELDVARANAGVDPASAEAFDRLDDLLNKPALGAFPRRETLEDPIAEEIYREHPERLAALVTEMLRFSTDERRAIAVASEFAAELGIPDDVAEAALVAGVRLARGRRQGHHDGR